MDDDENKVCFRFMVIEFGWDVSGIGGCIIYEEFESFFRFLLVLG